MSVARIGIVGAGVMGRGTALAFALHGFAVRLVDVAEPILRDALDAIARDARLMPLLAPGMPRAEPAAILSRITPTLDLADLADVDLVVENATELVAVKVALFERLDAICRPQVILCADTSAIPIATFAAATSRPTRVAGLHFMNPVPLKETVEVIRAPTTSDATIADVTDFLKRIGKTAIVVRDAPGFVTNRVMMLTVNEAIALVEERVAAPADVDALFVRCFGHSMGPLATADLIGLDTVALSLDVLRHELGDDKFDARPMLRRLVAAGRLGCKSGEGFFRYPSPGG